MYKLIRSLLIPLLILFSAQSAAQNLKVYAASSMTNSIKEIGEKFKEKTGIKVITVFGGSASLARQIEKGAPADIYISANEKWMDYLIEKNVVKPTNSRDIARNRLVIVSGSKSGITEFSPEDKKNWMEVTKNSRLAVGQTDSVPAGIYAKQAMEFLGVWDEMKPRLAAANNVRFALALVERGETDIGIVYQTDAIYSDAVTSLAVLPEESHAPIMYPAARLTDSNESEQFYDFLFSDEANSVLNRYGFQSIDTQTVNN
ncbi:molybdate ABC transporter substrate-binding protein [Vibrio sp. HN007]|uniref:molybdate ABC transporter substrate-binding protein n=1 Tax=Vibrio iocasae TaxID=3098914 RepID=UPI0035D4207C